MARLLGIDVGTSGAKAVLIDESGAVLRQASSPYELSTPQPRWAEQDPADWVRGVLECIAQIGESSPDAIGLTGQMHGSVFLDKDGEVLAPAILWCDQRTGADCREIEEAVGAERLVEITGNPAMTGFQLPKILWLRNNRRELFDRLDKVLLPKDYVRLVLTGATASDVSDASGTGLLDVQKRDWSEEILKKLSLPPSWFPEVFESDEIVGETREVEGLKSGVPVVAGAGDQAAGAVGSGAVSPGITSVSLGTSGVAFAPLAAPADRPGRTVHSFCHANRAWHAMGVMLSCGGAVAWARDLLYPDGGFDQMNQEAAAAPVGCDGLTFLPYLAGERCPHDDPSATGAFVGLTLRHGREHLARAVFEGATFGVLDCLDQLKSCGADPAELRVVGGGASSDFWMQVLADASGLKCWRLSVDEGPASGAAILAGVGLGIWPDTAQACQSLVSLDMSFEPKRADYSESRDRYRTLYPALKTWIPPKTSATIG
ncbi:MAG: xylulokinase [Armatimonadetes bacterium]|nr:xylulokinase [Armatimonadota bacterium]